MDGSAFDTEFLGIGLGSITNKKTDNFILKLRGCLGLMLAGKQYNLKNSTLLDGTFGYNIGADIIFRFNSMGLSIGPDLFMAPRNKNGNLFVISIGLNILHDF